MSTTPNFDEIAENFAFLDDWEDRYRYLIELGQTLEPLSEAERNAANKVHGCVSQVWLATQTAKDAEGRTVMVYHGESDAMIVKGLVAVLIALYSGKTPQEVEQTDAIGLFDEMGLREHLTTQRSNGLVAMVRRIKDEAKAVA